MEELKKFALLPKDIEDQIEKLKTLVRIEGGSIILDDDYEIDLERIQTPAELIHWICQLSGKSWITKAMLSRFICLVCEHHNFNIPGGYY